MNQPARKRDPEATQTAILETAQALFVEFGMDAVSMRNIALQSGVTKSLIHHHFQTKEQLWCAVKERMFAEYADMQMAIFDSMPGGPDMLRHTIRVYFNFVREHPEIVRLWCWTCLEGDSQAGFVERQLIQRGVAKLTEAQEKGLLRADVNPMLLIVQLVGMTNQWFLARERYQMWAEPSGEQPSNWDELFLAQFERLFIDGVSPSDSEPSS